MSLFCVSPDGLEVRVTTAGFGDTGLAMWVHPVLPSCSRGGHDFTAGGS